MRVHNAFRWFKDHQLAMYVPSPSHRLLEGITHLQTVIHRMDAAEEEMRRQNPPPASE